MRVLLVNTNTNRFIAPPPVGLAHLVPGLQQRGASVSIADLMFASDPAASLTEAMRTFRPHVVGFSLRNLDDQHMFSPATPLPQIRALVRLARQAGAKTVLGGTAFTTLPTEMLRYMGAECGIAGQGEESFPALVESLIGDRLDTEIPGLVYPIDGQVMTNPPDHSGYAKRHADWSLHDLRRYKRLVHPGAYPAAIVTKSGCGFKCSYCDAGAVMGRHFRCRPIEDVLADIENVLCSHGCRAFFFADPCFNHPLDHAKELLRGIIDSGLQIRFATPVAPIRKSFDEEFFELFRRAGGIFMMLGAESLSSAMLRSYRKPFGYDDALSFAHMARHQGINVGLDLLFGGPAETNDTIDDCLERLDQFPHTVCVAGVGVRVLPGTELYDVARSEGAVGNGSSLLQPTFYCSPSIDPVRTDKVIRSRTRPRLGQAPRLAALTLSLLLARQSATHTKSVVSLSP